MMSSTGFKIAIGLTVFLVGCGFDSSSGSAPSLDPRFSKSGRVQFVSDPQNEVSSSAQKPEVSSLASGLSISLALSILPPVTSQTGGVQLYASDIKVIGNRVITGYNVPGNVQRGWLDYVDVTTLALPLLIDSEYLPDTDVNSVTMAGGKFAITGAKESSGATLRTGTYGLGMNLNSGDTYLSSYAGTGITYDSTGTKLAVTTGDTGKVSILNATTLVAAGVADLADARGVTYSAVTGRFYAVSGKPSGGPSAAVTSYNSTAVAGASTPMTGGATPESKGTIVAGSNSFLLATTGEGGFNVICAADMNIAASVPQYTYSNYASLGLPSPALTVTNAATFGPGLIFTASGEAGVRVYNFLKKSGPSPTSCQNVQVTYQGFFEFNNAISVNNVYYANVLTTLVTYTGTLYIAAGGGGFKAVTVLATRNALTDIIEY